MERIEIKPPRWQMGLMVLGILAFVAFGVFMILAGEEVTEQAMGCLAIIFFGGFGSYALYLMSRGQGKLAVVPAGVEVGIPGVMPRVLPWNDIDAFGVNTIENQEFTTITLKNPHGWLAGISPQEAAAAVGFFRKMGLMGQATVEVALASEEDKEEYAELQKLAASSKEVKTLLDILAYNREKFGAEFLLGWNLRDRSAKDFAAFLEQQRQQRQGQRAA